MKSALKIFLLLIALWIFPGGAFAASRFWVPLTITGAISGTGGLCRLTVNNTANLSSGNAVIVAGIVGATACDGTTTVTTVINSTTVEVNLSFGLTYTSGGTLAGGQWTSSGTGNWAATTGGSPGQSVPGASDSATFDGSSGGGTVIVNFGGTVSLQFLVLGAFTGTFDNSVNNNNFTLSATSGALSLTGTGARAIKLGTATYTLTGSGVGTVLDITTVTNMTLTAASSTIALNGAVQTIVANATLGTVSLGSRTGTGRFTDNSNSHTIGTLQIAAPNWTEFGPNVTLTVTNAMAITGTASSPIMIKTPTTNTTTTISSAAASTCTWCSFKDITFTGGGSFAATSSTDFGNNTGITITAPVTGGGGHIIGG